MLDEGTEKEEESATLTEAEAAMTIELLSQKPMRELKLLLKKLHKIKNKDAYEAMEIVKTVIAVKQGRPLVEH
jgi:hypothetical protein